MIWSLIGSIILPVSPAETFYIGTYTKPGGSQGIYRSTLDPATGQLSAPGLAAEAENPSWLTLRPDGRFLYAVLEFTGGQVAAYRVLPDGGLVLANRESWEGRGPCHASVDPTGQWLLASAYGQGSLGLFPIGPDGRLGPVYSTFQNNGSGPNKSRQSGPHLHSAYFAGGKAIACDLGTDQILVFDVTRDGLVPGPSASTHPGGGPRHLAFHPNGKTVYVNLEMGNAVSAFSWDDRTLRWRQTVKTLPHGVQEEGKTTAAIVCSSNGKQLYVSNRGHDSIAVFSLSGRDRMKLVEIAPAGVKEPRGMALDPTGRWLVVGGQASDDVVSLRIDPNLGKLSGPVSRISVGSPVCVAFQKALGF